VAISNVGNITADTSRIDIEIFVRPADAADDSEDILLWTGRPPVPGPHSTDAGRLPKIGLPPDMDLGEYVIGLKVDTSNEVEESNEDNNTALTTESIEVVDPYIDLIVASVSLKVPDYVTLGTQTKLGVTVRNVGPLRAEAVFDIEIFAVHVGGTYVGIKTYRVACPPYSRTFTFEISWPSDMIPGYYFLGVKVDSSDEVEELREDNNTALIPEPILYIRLP
jgi:hypothetical protein